MKICILGSIDSVHIQRWIKSLLEYGHEIAVISLYPGHADKVTCVILPKRFKLFYVSHYFVIREFLLKFKPDILHAHHASSYGFLGALQNFHPFIVSVWGYDVLQFYHKSMVHKMIIKYALRRSDHITATSNALAKAVHEITNLKASVIPFGVDESLFEIKRNYNKKPLVIGVIKDLKPVYGIDVLIKAFSELAKSFQEIKLLIVGNGELKDSFIKLCDRLDIKSGVEIRGRVPHDNIGGVLARIDIFVVPSLSEGFGVVAIEAMATGLPVVASRIGGLPEVVDDGKTGALVEPGNVEELRKALEYYILNRDIRIEHGKQGRKKAESLYNWKDNAREMQNLYERVVLEHKK